MQLKAESPDVQAYENRVRLFLIRSWETICQCFQSPCSERGQISHVMNGDFGLKYIRIGSGSRKDLRIRKSGNGSFAQFPGADTLS